jgi:hypothetical protein
MSKSSGRFEVKVAPTFGIRVVRAITLLTAMGGGGARSGRIFFDFHAGAFHFVEQDRRRITAGAQ